MIVSRDIYPTYFFVDEIKALKKEDIRPVVFDLYDACAHNKIERREM